ncbi:MAG TPA: site-specific integrase [Candidatus Acidoferrales bacterium]|nr:site-specific integrase [Candidatus Acidoferrales bacterium]
MSIYRRGGTYWFTFIFNGERIQKSTKQRNRKAAIDIESAYRTALAKGDVGIIERKAAPTLKHFLEKDFLAYVDTKHAAKPNTLRYYHTGVKSLVDSSLAQFKVGEISDQHAQQYAAKHPTLSPSTINCGLRTLRRAIYLAAEWGVTERRPKISLAKGERQRDRVLTDAEVTAYLTACEQPWRDVATVMLGTGMRPGEALSLRWENVLFGKDAGLIQITTGKSKAARRVLPMVPAVRKAIESRWKDLGEPTEGWVFTSAASEAGHLVTVKDFHARALKAANGEAKATSLPALKSFEPYILRHTALTRLGESGCDAFTLARIAGHSSITITQRYVHPQADAIERAFGNYKNHYTSENAFPAPSDKTPASTSIVKV